MGFLNRLFGKKDSPILKEFSEEECKKDYELKSQALEYVFGKMHNIVGHAIIPFNVGGTVDMYYFPNHIKETGFATMELLAPDGNGQKKNKFGTYELVAFKKYYHNIGEDTQTSFNIIERKACEFLTAIGMFSSEAILNPKETIEVPSGKNEKTLLWFLTYITQMERNLKLGIENIICYFVCKYSKVKWTMQDRMEVTNYLKY